jgi:hypothetical protein
MQTPKPALRASSPLPRPTAGCPGRARSFIVKGGEDVRIDERLQQLMRLMSGLAGRDPDCVARGLAGGSGGGAGAGAGGSPGALVTYDVVAMSPRLGLLEFVQVGRSRYLVVKTRLPESGRAGGGSGPEEAGMAGERRRLRTFAWAPLIPAARAPRATP